MKIFMLDQISCSSFSALMSGSGIMIDCERNSSVDERAKMQDVDSFLSHVLLSFSCSIYSAITRYSGLYMVLCKCLTDIL